MIIEATLYAPHLNSISERIATLPLLPVDTLPWVHLFRLYSEISRRANLKKKFSGLRNEEEKALVELWNNTEITIKPAGNGAVVVIFNTSDYAAECNMQLNNTSFYKHLDSDPIILYNVTINYTLQQGIKDNDIDSNIAEDLLVPHPAPRRFYIRPKIHKEGTQGGPF
ncbi:hypothetical protein PoB_005118200 [Plakobranchus ocellatus]|uniref:Uncharacterized protein n=1 Tax=Plakobranchus ocellatus TaxID=259542 RepID=A0AAV4C078_9GAST|nr:hypothetical protein PoB_005118200 [Plakobranchus ocellatus]